MLQPCVIQAMVLISFHFPFILIQRLLRDQSRDSRGEVQMAFAHAARPQWWSPTMMGYETPSLRPKPGRAV